MTNIQQIYCTHCTYGSSAIERRDGALAERVLGYSARSSSLDVTELRKSYRHVERFLYYYLPADTPPEEKLRIDASHAPRRLVYYPSINGLQMLGQISYRQQDTVGRPGSYFGHVLFSERDGGPWNVLDCLQLWGAGWADEDSPDIPFDMPALDELGQLRGGLQPIINDALLLSFLKTPPGKPFDDPHGLIPERWKITSEGERAALLTDVLQGYLSLGANRRESVLLVIEPSLAALVFYGVARLLPRGQLRDEISFSTFEPSAERLPVALAATTFHLPGTTDLRPEFYRGRGYVNNTFLKKCSERSRADGTYARVVIEKLLAAGWPDVDRVLHGFEVAKAANARDLEELAQILELVPTLLDPAAELPQLQWSPVALNYLGRAMRERLAHEPAGSPLLAALVGTPRHLSTLKLIATDPKSPEAAEAIQFLLQRLPEEGFAELVASDRITRRFKIDALIGFVEGHRKFPEPCDPLWGATIGKRAAEGGSAESLLAKLLTKLSGGALEKLAANVPKPRSERFLLALIETCRRSPTKQSALGLLARQIGELDDEQLCQFLIRNAAECPPDTFPKQITALRDRLPGLLKNLPTAGGRFDGQLDLLRAWVDHFPDVAEAEKRLEHWGTLRATLFTLRDVSPLKPSKGLGKSPVDYDAVGRKLAETLRRVMPDQEYQDDVTGNERVTCLRRLGAVVLGRSEFLPDDVWEKTRNYFQYGTFTKATFRSTKLPSQARHQRPKKSKSWTRAMLPFIIATALGSSVPFVLWWKLASRPSGELAQGEGSNDKSDGTKKPANHPKRGPNGGTTKKVDAAPEKPEPVPTKIGESSNGESVPNGKSNAKEQSAGGAPSVGTIGDRSITPGANEPPKKSDPPEKPLDEADASVEQIEDAITKWMRSRPETPNTVAKKKDGTKAPRGSHVSEPPPTPSEMIFGDIPMLGADGAPGTPEITSTVGAIGETPFTLHGHQMVKEKVGQSHWGFRSDNSAKDILYVYSSDPNGQERKLAKFYLTTRRTKAKFQWLMTKPNVNQEECARLLRACVLEINTIDSPHPFFVLWQKVKMPAAKFDESGLAEIPIKYIDTEWWKLKYRLGHGKLTMDHQQPILFGDVANTQPPYSLQLPETTSESVIDATIERDNKNYDDWVRISIRSKDGRMLPSEVLEKLKGATVSAVLYRYADACRVEDVVIGGARPVHF